MLKCGETLRQSLELFTFTGQDGFQSLTHNTQIPSSFHFNSHCYIYFFFWEITRGVDAGANRFGWCRTFIPENGSRVSVRFSKLFWRDFFLGSFPKWPCLSLTSVFSLVGDWHGEKKPDVRGGSVWFLWVLGLFWTNSESSTNECMVNSGNSIWCRNKKSSII